LKTFLALAATALLVVSANAQAWKSYFHGSIFVRAADVCPRVNPIHIGGTQGYADSLGPGKCYVAIDPIDTTGMVYRGVTFFGDGLMMVFSSYGEGGTNTTMTSAREFFFFPRTGAPALEMDEAAGTVSVVMADGGRVHIEPSTAQIKSFARGSVTVSPRIDPAERGGVEVTAYTGLMLDAGFRKGESPSGRANAESTFRDALGRTCTVKNSELFAYANGEHELKYTDAQLSGWLKTRCPKLTPGF
jgi:hypothetical protein